MKYSFGILIVIIFSLSACVGHFPTSAPTSTPFPAYSFPTPTLTPTVTPPPSPLVTFEVGDKITFITANEYGTAVVVIKLLEKSYSGWKLDIQSNIPEATCDETNSDIGCFLAFIWTWPDGHGALSGLEGIGMKLMTYNGQLIVEQDGRWTVEKEDPQ